MAEVTCENRNPARPVNIKAVERAINEVLDCIGKKGSGLNIIFVSNQKIRALNRRYLGRDSSTDVIAFREGDLPRGERKTEGFLGDIAVSSDKTAQNAEKYGVSFSEELTLYVIHGILHLAGYEDRTGRGRARMKKAENEIFKKIRTIS